MPAGPQAVCAFEPPEIFRAPHAAAMPLVVAGSPSAINKHFDP